jgi:hypothetical protein
MKRGGAALAQVRGVTWASSGAQGMPDRADGNHSPAGGGHSARPRIFAWWRAWRERFGLAEVCGTVAAAGGFAAGYLTVGLLQAAAGVATVCEAFGFYGYIGAKTVAAAARATAHLGGWRRLAAGAWHAVREQLASCVVAEALDGFLVRPGCMAGGAWLLRGLPGGMWLGFLAGKAAADVAWYGTEACARRGLARSVAAMSAESLVPAPVSASRPVNSERSAPEHRAGSNDVDAWPRRPGYAAVN